MVKVKKTAAVKKQLKVDENVTNKRGTELNSHGLNGTNNKSLKTMETKKRKNINSISDSNVVKKQKTKSTEKVKAPTLEELNELKETRNLFHSNLFRLQVKEMLSEIKVKDKYKIFVNSWLDGFKQFVRKLDNMQDKENIDEMNWAHKSGLEIPFPIKDLGITQQKSFQFQFIKPTVEPYLIGAFATQTWIGAKLVADVCLPMPAECFQKDNYLNLIYDQKRALYLMYIAKEMLKSKQFEGLTIDHLQFNYFANNPFKSVLEITPTNTTEKIASKVMIRLFIAAEEQTFKLSRFVPWNNNIRANLFDYDDDDASLQISTPVYNANVLFDLSMQRNQQILCETFLEHVNFQDGLLLLKVWIQQRQLNRGFSGFSSHVLAMYIAYLFKQRKLHAKMSSYQVARTVWNQLAHSTWDEPNKGISLCQSENTTTNQPTIEQFHTHYDVVFIDVTGFYNICANLSLEIYRRVRMESKIAVDMLNDMKLNSFQYIFMTKCPLYSQFDHILKINKEDVIEQILDMHVSPHIKLNYAGNIYPQLLQLITSLLSKGLGKRVLSLLPIEEMSTPWRLNDVAQQCSKHLHVGIILNPDNAFEILDKGPETIAEESEEFRKFWGDKANLRRFQDGSITESVVWASSTDTLMKKRLIVRTIVLHLLQHHFQIEDKDIDYIAGEFDMVYKLTSAFKTDRLHNIDQDTDAEALSLKVIHAFDDLARKLQSLDELPLEIVSIAGISSVFRYCEPVPILPQARFINDKLFASSVERGVIQLGSSGKWPGELAALRALKTAFYIQIAKLLREKHNLRTEITYDGILILTNGYCFGIEIAHPKEVALLKKEKTERGITQYVDCEASIALEKRHYILPKVTGAMHALYQMHPSFGATVMIAKRWLYSQLIDDGLWPDECTELLIASQFLRTNSQLVTTSPQTGFIRFLHLLGYTDWKAEMFLINFNNVLDDNQVSELEHQFNAARETFPPLCIISGYDHKHYGKLWSTANKPNCNVLARVTILARQTLAIIESSLFSPDVSIIKPSKLFLPSNQGYDLVIQLKPDMVPNTLATDFGSSFAALSKPNWRLPLADTNFVKSIVMKLREGYSDFAAFFYNPCGGKEICVVWKPAAVFAKKEFKVADVNGCALCDTSSNTIQCKKEILIEDFKFILKDFYLRIDTVDAVWNASREKIFVKKERYFEPKTKTTNIKTEDAKNVIFKQKSIKPEGKKSKVKNVKTIEKQSEIRKQNIKVKNFKAKKKS